MAQEKPKKIIVVVPVFNEALNLERLIRDFEQSCLASRIERFEFVDDGSVDSSYNILTEIKSKFKINVNKHEKNLGVASAFETGFRASLINSNPADHIIVTIEADNTSDLSILPKLIEIIDSNEADVALASCYQDGGGVVGTNICRQLLSRIANLILRFRFPQIKTSTYSSFYRAYRMDLVAKVIRNRGSEIFVERGFVSMVEMLLLCRALDARFKEFPMILDASKRMGKSKMKVIRTILGYFRLVIRRWPQLEI